jgi:hypothetical protein
MKSLCMEWANTSERPPEEMQLLRKAFQEFGGHNSQFLFHTDDETFLMELRADQVAHLGDANEQIQEKIGEIDPEKCRCHSCNCTGKRIEYPKTPCRVKGDIPVFVRLENREEGRAHYMSFILRPSTGERFRVLHTWKWYMNEA